MPVKKKVELDCGGYETSINQWINYLLRVTAREIFHSLDCDSLLKISLQTCEIFRHNVNAVKHKSDDMYLSRGKAMANYPQEFAQDAVCQSHTGHMTGLWFLPARTLRLNTNEWMNIWASRVVRDLCLAGNDDVCCMYATVYICVYCVGVYTHGMCLCSCSCCCRQSASNLCWNS